MTLSYTRISSSWSLFFVTFRCTPQKIRLVSTLESTRPVSHSNTGYPVTSSPKLGIGFEFFLLWLDLLYFETNDGHICMYLHCWFCHQFISEAIHVTYGHYKKVMSNSILFPTSLDVSNLLSRGRQVPALVRKDSVRSDGSMESNSSTGSDRVGRVVSLSTGIYKRQISISQCYSSLHCLEYGHISLWHIYDAGKTYDRDRSCVVEFLLQLENKQQNMPNNVETRHKHMYPWYIDCLCKMVFPTCMSRFTCIMTSQVFVKRMQWSIALSSAFL